jgi:TRAP-type C4-dicarboxylate transport system substrate-binding protein
VHNHTEIPGSPTFYTATFVLAMNKPKYESLPADLKQVLDKLSGQKAAAMAGQVWDEQAVVVSEMVKKRGNTIITLPEEEVVRWRKATNPVIDTWLSTVKDKNLDGARLLDSARTLLDKYEKAA